MGIIKAFCGLNGYKDEECVRDVLNYAIGSKFFYGLVSGNIEGDPGNVYAVSIVAQLSRQKSEIFIMN